MTLMTPVQPIYPYMNLDPWKIGNKCSVLMFDPARNSSLKANVVFNHFSSSSSSSQMSQPFPLEILSDDDDKEEPQQQQESSPFSFHPKKRRKEKEDQFTLKNVVVLDDDPTPKKPNPSSPSPSPSFVPDTPLSSYDCFKSDSVSIVKCTSRLPNSQIESLPKSAFEDESNKILGFSGFICLDSDNESEGGIRTQNVEENEKNAADQCFSDSAIFSDNFEDKAVHGECFSKIATNKVPSDNEEQNVATERVGNSIEQKYKLVDEEKSDHRDETKSKKRKTKEEKARLAEEKKLKREQEKLQKEALKAEAAEAKNLQKEQQMWEKGKFALKSIVAEIDAKVVELGSIGGHLLSMFADKGLSFRITSNPIERSILWTMSVPEQFSELLSSGIEIPYVLLVYEAEEFCNLLSNESFMGHVLGVQSRYSSYTVCYITNKLMAYINKREHAQYKNQTNSGIWTRPPVDEALSKLTTDFARVHSRQCRDEAELADHVVGLTCALATCHFRKKLTRLSINANGTIVSKDSIDRNIIKKNVWLKALVAIPKVQPRFAVAIWKKYPTMKSLLKAYMDPSKSVHEKELLLENLLTEGLLSDADRRLGPVCSRRVYRVLMAQSGNNKTDEVELGADFFRNQ